jgi:hypothetical protein
LVNPVRRPELDGLASVALLAPLWCPLPLTAEPLPPQQWAALEWGEEELDDPSGPRRLLVPRRLALEAVLRPVERLEQRQELVAAPPPPPAPARRKRGGAAAGKSASPTGGKAGKK